MGKAIKSSKGIHTLISIFPPFGVTKYLGKKNANTICQVDNRRLGKLSWLL